MKKKKHYEHRIMLNISYFLGPKSALPFNHYCYKWDLYENKMKDCY